MTCLFARIRTDLRGLPWWSRAETSPPFFFFFFETSPPNEGVRVRVPSLVGS